MTDNPKARAALVDLAERLRSAEIAALYRAWRLSDADVRDEILGRYVYAEVAETTVDPEIVRAAHRAAGWCADDLLLPVSPRVVWFAPENDADRAHVARWGARDWAFLTSRRPVRGLTLAADRSTVYVRATLELAAAVSTVAHECRHLDQPPGMADAEPDAIDYENRVRERLLSHVC